MDDGTGLAQAAGPCAVDALLASSRALTAITTRLLEPAAGETTSAQYRVLAVLALHDPMRMTDLSAAWRSCRHRPRGCAIGSHTRA